MVKLFVGNLADSVDSHRLKNLFLQYVQVQECDVLKNFAFVHVVSEEDAEICIKKLNKTTLEGRELHLERSTSKLRKEPGMSDKCFTCGAIDHKTPNCPQELNRRKKRALEGYDEDDLPPSGKKPTVLPTINLTGGPVVPSPSWGCKVGGGNDADPELPCPTNPELRTLYDQYLDARTKYFFYRERLSKELSLQPLAAPVHVGRYDMTKQQPHLTQMNKSIVMQPGQMTASAPAMQYSTAPVSYQPTAVGIQQPLPQSVYASTAPPNIQPTPASAYSRPLASYATTAPVSQQPLIVQPGQQAAPYNSMVRQPPAISSVNYAIPPQSSATTGPYLVPQNGQSTNAPATSYSSNAYRVTPQQQLYTNTVPSYGGR